MDHEKKYKNALANARQKYNTTENLERKQWLEELFPELKESEDEKIRKEIIAFLKENLETGRADETWSLSGLERWIAWLEKQGKIEPKFYKGEWLCENAPNNYARFIQILEIINEQGKYRISRDIHNDEDIVEFDFLKKYYHEFDINDTKPGDIIRQLKET